MKFTVGLLIGILFFTGSAQAGQCPEVLSSIYSFLFDSAGGSRNLITDIHQLRYKGSPQHDADIRRIESTLAMFPVLMVRGRGYAFGSNDFTIDRDDQTAAKICGGNYSANVNNPAYANASQINFWTSRYVSEQVTVQDELGVLAGQLEELSQRIRAARLSLPKGSDPHMVDFLAREVSEMQNYLGEGTNLILQ